MNGVLQALILLIAATCLAGGWWYTTGGLQPPKTSCNPATLKTGEICLKTALTDPALQTSIWIDARSRQDYQQSHYPNALFLTNHPDEDWHSLLETAAPQLMGASSVIVYCSSQQCHASAEVAKRLREIGLSETVYVLHGGWEALVAAKLVDP